MSLDDIVEYAMYAGASTGESDAEVRENAKAMIREYCWDQAKLASDLQDVRERVDRRMEARA